MILQVRALVPQTLKVSSILHAQCGNYRNLLSYFFDKNFVKGKVLLEKLLKSRFRKIFFDESEIHDFSHFEYRTVWKFQNLSFMGFYVKSI